MSDWAEGYVSEVDYTYGYYDGLNPLRLTLPFLNVGLAPPPVATACELGFGQGVSVALHAAASDIRWWGTDVNPAHAGFARSLAAAAGAEAKLFDQSFAEFCNRADLPEFDFIGVHGVWSWISEENERLLIDFIRRKLAVGGVLYVSYNTQPGLAAMVPLRQLLMQHIEVMAPSGRGITSQVEAALEFAERLLALPSVFGSANPLVAQRLGTMKGQSRNYLAHEYFNRDWRAMQFGDMAQRLVPAKLSFAGSAWYLDHVEALNMTPDQQRFVSEIPDLALRQAVRDFVVCQTFRRDYWVKGGRRLAPLDQAEAVRRVRVTLAAPRADLANTVAGALGPREMAATVYNPILDAIGDDGTPTLGELEQALAGELRLGTLFEAVMVLIGKNELAIVQDDDVQEAARRQTEPLNRHLCDKARGSGDIMFLASPVTGGGIAALRFHQLYLLALRQGRQSTDELAHYAWDILSPQGQRVVRDGKALESAEDNLAELTAQAGDFLEKRLPLLQKLKIA